MENSLVISFQSTVHKLCFTNKSGSEFPQDEFLGCILTLIKSSHKISLERFSQLQNIINIDNPILLAYKSSTFWQAKVKEMADKSITGSSITIRKSTKPSSSSLDRSSVVGSPLKLDIIADLSVFIEEEEVGTTSSKSKSLDCGVALGRARKLASIFCHSFNKITTEMLAEQGEIPNLVVLCDGNNLKSVSCLCVVPVIDKQNNFIGFKMSQVASKPSTEKGKVPKSVPEFANKEVRCYAKYDIISYSGDKLNLDCQNSLYLELHWRKHAGQLVILLHDPPIDAISNVKVQVTSGNTGSPAFSMYQELEILRSIITGFVRNEVQWIGNQERPLVEAAKDLVEQLKLGSDTIDYTAGDTSGEEELRSLDSAVLEERKDLDFTDHLWKILHNCTAFSELVETFEYVVRVLRQGELQPFIHKDNTTTIAQMVKDSYRGQLRTPSLSGLTPLIYLAEIGIQKLTHDYIHIFLSKNLSTRGHLEYFMKTNLELEERFERLSKLQNILEVVIILKQSLDLPQSTLSDNTRQMLKHYEQNAVDDAYQFLLPVPTSALSGVLERYTLCEWKAESSKLVENILERNVYHFSVDPLIDWVVFPAKNGSKGSSGDAGEISYFLTQLRDSVSILS